MAEKQDKQTEVFLLVKTPNWSTCTDVSVLKGKSRNDLICPKHKNKKLALLIHEIEGFVIEESNLPFKEEQDEEASKGIETSNENVANQNDHLQGDGKENEIVNASTNSYPEDKDELMSLLPTKCKYCGNELPEQRAMWGKRFCNASCGKRYQVQCSKRAKKNLTRRSGGVGRGGKRNVSKDGGGGVDGGGEKNDEIDFTPVKQGKGKGRRMSGSTSNRNGLHSPDTSIYYPQPNFYDGINLDFTFPPRQTLGFGLDEYDVENELYDGGEPITLFSLVPVVTWSIEDVVDYVRGIPGCESSAEAFAMEEIDGKSFLLLRVDHMVQTMDLKLGPALKIASCLRDIKMEYGIQTRTKYLSSPS